MPNKCSVGYCNSNYDNTDERVTIHSFPRDKDEAKRWLAKLPNIITVRDFLILNEGMYLLNLYLINF